MELQEYEKHIKRSEANSTKSYCGEYVGMDWSFQNIDHAVLSLEQEERLTPCPLCVEKILAILHSSTGKEFGY